MNCKPGDLAVIVRSRKHCGKLVEVLYIAPGTQFRLPDGHNHLASPPNSWVVKFQSLIQAQLTAGAVRATLYAIVGDAYLRPIRDQDGEDETLSWAPVPTKQGVPA